MEQQYTELFLEWEEIFREFDNDRAMELVYGIFEKAKTGENPTFSDTDMRLGWLAIRGTMDRWGEKKRRNRENGKKGGAPKGNKNAIKTTETTDSTENNPKQPTVEKNNPHNQNQNQNHNHNQVVAYVGELDQATANEIVDEWNNNLTTLNIASLKPMTKRWDNLRLTLANHPYGELITVIRDIDNQAFFQKKAQEGSRVTFDWFIQPDNFQKVFEGNYKHGKEELPQWV